MKVEVLKNATTTADQLEIALIANDQDPQILLSATAVMSSSPDRCCIGQRPFNGEDPENWASRLKQQAAPGAMSPAQGSTLIEVWDRKNMRSPGAVPHVWNPPKKMVFASFC